MSSIKKQTRPRKKAKARKLDDYTIDKQFESMGLRFTPARNCYLPIMLKKVTVEQIKQTCKAVVKRYLDELKIIKQRQYSPTKYADLGLEMARRFGVDLTGVSEPKYRDFEIDGHPAIEVYDIDPKIRQFAHELAEHICRFAESKRYKERRQSTPEARFIGMMGAWAYALSVYKSTVPALKNFSFGGADDCDVEFDGKLFDVKTNRRPKYELNVNKAQFDKPRPPPLKPFAAYIAVKIAVDKKAKIKELIEQSHFKAYILGYATPDEIKYVFNTYKVGEEDSDGNYGVLPSFIYNKATCKYDKDKANPWCYISMKKLGDVNKFVSEAIDNIFKDKYTGDSVDPRLDKDT